MKYKVLSIGTMYVDINCYDFPGSDRSTVEQEVIGENYEVVPGGSALNFARTCVAMGLSPVFIGKSGKDKMGTLLSDLVSETGVIPAFIQSADVTTNIGMNFIAKDGAATMMVAGSANRSLNIQEVEQKIDEYLPEVEYMYLGGCFKLKTLLASYKKLAGKAREMGVKVVLDHGRVTNKVSQEDMKVIRELVPVVDYYLPSKNEFLSVWGVEDIEAGIRRVQECSKAVVIVKNAQNGAVGCDGSQLVSVPGFKVTVIHAVGAGDSFNAGLIKAQDMKLDLEESIRFACATAAVKISGAELPTPEKVDSLMNRR